MMTKKITVVVETGKDMFSCFMVGEHKDVTGLIGTGKTARKAVEDFYLCYEEEKDWCRKEGREIPALEFDFVFDVGAFFNYYFINVSAFAQYAGINASLLRQYSSGLKSPSKKSIGKVREAIEKFRKDIDAGVLIDRPVLQYV
ncbi:MAG: pilus assembly protein HicB [Prevotella sp.]|nr:pilus assembly protein HicB [Prevotella sp.]